MRGVEVCSLERDNNALTAVIEFLSAFALFLMILTAFLSLAQLQMVRMTLMLIVSTVPQYKAWTALLRMAGGLFRWASQI